MPKSKLFFKGSSGCIFRPQIPCDKSKNKKTRKKVTKLFIRKNKEYKIGQLVRKIPNHKEWTILWERVCKSPNYRELIKTTEINECLESLNTKPNSLPDNYRFTLYQGLYGGLTLEMHSKKYMKQKDFNSKSAFIKIFTKYFKLLHNIFLGLTMLEKYNICHEDINIRNILIKGCKSYIIDYDIAIILDKELKNKLFLSNRMTEEYNNYSRIYEIYPYEYIYYNLNKELILKEQTNIALFQNRLNYYELYDPIHHKLFNTDTDNLRFELLEDKLNNNDKTDLYELMRKLDVYSVGMSILILFIEICEEYNISIDSLIQLFKTNELKHHMDLIRDMVEFDHRKRITAGEAYERYLNLI